MKKHRTKKRQKNVRTNLLFGDFVEAMCVAWGRRMGLLKVQQAVNERQVEFLGRDHFLIWGESGKVPDGLR